MQFVMIAYNEALDEEVTELLEENGAAGYTKWTKVYGKGQGSGPHLGTHVWPKANNVIVTAVPDEDAARILQQVQELRARVRAEGLKAFSWGINEVT